jgi:hypothetical protein
LDVAYPRLDDSDRRDTRPARAQVRPPTAPLRARPRPADPRGMRRLLLALPLVLTLVAPAAAPAYPSTFGRVAHNPADALERLPIERFTYDPATHCVKHPAPGATALERWLGAHERGVSWGILRCERWGKRSASLHAEGRAVDWHLDVHDPADARAARHLISTLLAPDAAGRPAALARRMGVQEIIFDCRAWFGGGGAPALQRYSACDGAKKVDDTTAHRNHVHLGLTRRGAAKRTSFWTRTAPPRDLQDLAAAPLEDFAGPSPAAGA